MQEAIRSLLQPGDVFVDVGANIGFFTLVASKSAGSTGQLFAFEARPDIARAAMGNLRRNGVEGTVVNAAVGDIDGRATLLVADHPGGSTIEPSMAVDVVRSVDVQQVAIDSMLATGRLPAPNVVKIDVEGAEVSVLRGMSQCLRNCRPVLIIELDGEKSDDVERRFRGLESLLAEYDYRCERLAPSYAHSNWNVVHFVAQYDGPTIDEAELATVRDDRDLAGPHG